MEYVRLKKIEEDKADYYSALRIKLKNKKWTSHSEVKRRFGI
jgi:hypothetical protein